MKTASGDMVHVWLVEDNATFANAVQRVVGGLDGMTCPESFRSVEEAFAAMERGGSPDVILLDVQLPGMDGITVLSTLKKHAPKARISIHTVSTHIQRVYEKLHVSTNTGAVAKALRERLI